MIKSIDFLHYRKIQNIKLDFEPGINAISGQNGTCKSSILHIIGNSYQKIRQNNPDVDTRLFNVIKKINQTVNPKIESLTKGDKEYNDPAIGVRGKLYTVEYGDDSCCEFRRHNNSHGNDTKRYRLIPKYLQGQNQSLEERAVIYLGLTRIVPIGELGDETSNIRSILPQEYQETLSSEYKTLTGISIDNIRTENSNDVKIRSEFTTEHDGIDSNTISAGEDNLFIILTALISLKWLHKETGQDSTLLIDEIDATLHPSIQHKLFMMLQKYSAAFNIQVFFTTHSLYLLEKVLKAKKNVLYLTSQANRTIKIMKKPNIHLINLHLKSEVRTTELSDKKIPVFTEDAEARILLEEIFNDLTTFLPDFPRIRNYFHFVDINLGSDNLRDLFNDRYLNKSVLKAICILDGDKTDDQRKRNVKILSLPKAGPPETIVFKHLQKLCQFENYDYGFWDQEQLEEEGYNFEWIQSEGLIAKVTNLIENYEREKAKKLFNEHKPFFILVFRHWLLKNKTNSLYTNFIKELNDAFKATANDNFISPNMWNLAKAT